MLQLWYKTKPGHWNTKELLMIDMLSVCFLKCLSYSTLFQSDLLPPPLELVFHSHKCIIFPSAVGNIMHLLEWGTRSKGGAISCCVEYVTPSALTFFQFRENTQ